MDSAMGNISETLSLGPEAFTGHRFMQDLKQDELKLHRTFSREVEAICQGKRFMLWRELCKLTGYVDETIIDEMVAGFDIVFLLGRELDKQGDTRTSPSLTR